MTRNPREEQVHEERELPMAGSLGGEALRTLGAVAALVALYYGLWQSAVDPGPVPTPAPLEYVHLTAAAARDDCGEPSKDGRPVVVEMLYSDNKQPWIEDAADRFAKRCPNIHVKLTAMGDIESANAILAGDEQPALWSPADELVVRYLESSAKGGGREADIHIGERVSLARSPLVVLTWRNQERVLDTITPTLASVEGPWAAMACAQIPRDPDLSHIELKDMVPGRWIDWYKASLSPSPGEKELPPAPRRAPEAAPRGAAPVPLEELERWGRVEFMHASPVRSAAGLETLYLMAYDYALPPAERAAAALEGVAPAAQAAAQAEGRIEGSEHLRDELQRRLGERKEALRRWIERCEAGLGQIPRSAEQLTASMYKHGPSGYDFVTTYEQLVFSQLKKNDSNESSIADLRVKYLQPTIVNRHPVVSLIPEGPDHDAVRQAAKRWIDFLRSDDIQKRAIEYGFRPATDAVKISEHRVRANPFLRMQRYGISFRETLTEPPRLDGEAVRELISLWEEATGRH
ncbi:substrate-binding domain-containing protein [Sorangium sp. So ce1036]|uniref:substrate-binding domain-containing protein n=1 Tax=Sorangium sp. So ce1036 TaxID=3133328 RepID=UPI003F022191